MMLLPMPVVTITGAVTEVLSEATSALLTREGVGRGSLGRTVLYEPKIEGDRVVMTILSVTRSARSDDENRTPGSELNV